MPRIIAGTARGRRLSAPPGKGTRPTADRMREGLFSSLAAAYGSLEDTRFLDLFAGSGAVGLEALSRGASHVLLVEQDRRAGATIAANITAVGLAGARVRVAGVGAVVATAADEPYDVVFADPPYDLSSQRLADLLRALRENGWLAADGMAVVERATRDRAFEWPAGYGADRTRAYGEGTLWYARAVEDPEQPDAST